MGLPGDFGPEDIVCVARLESGFVAVQKKRHAGLEEMSYPPQFVLRLVFITP